MTRPRFSFLLVTHPEAAVYNNFHELFISHYEAKFSANLHFIFYPARGFLGCFCFPISYLNCSQTNLKMKNTRDQQRDQWIRIKLFFCPQKVEKTTLKSCSEFSNPLFFPYCPDCPNGPDLHFRFIKNPMQPSVCWSGVPTGLLSFV